MPVEPLCRQLLPHLWQFGTNGYPVVADDGQALSFQPPSRWNGTGGFCVANGSRFRDGFIPSARLALDWRPDIVATEHATFYRFAPSRFRKIIAWAGRAETAVRALCPGGRIDEYYASPQPRR